MVEQAGSVEVEVRANLRRFNRGMSQAHRETRAFDTRARQAFRGTERGAAQMNRQLATTQTRMTGMTAAASTAQRTMMRMFAPMLGAAGVGGLVRGVRSATEEFDRLIKTADTFGLSTDFFQALDIAAIESGVDNLEQSLEAFTARVGEAAQGQGELHSRLKDTRPELLAAITAAEDQEARLRLLADAMNELESAEERAALARAAFSRSGVEMTRVMRQLATEQDTFIRRAREMGVVIDRDVLERAEELNNQMGVLSRTIDLEFKEAMVELAPVVVGSMRTASEAVSGFADNVGTAADRVAQGRRIISAAFDAIGVDAEDAAAKVETLTNILERIGPMALLRGDFFGHLSGPLGDLMDRLDPLDEQANEMADRMADARQRLADELRAMQDGEGLPHIVTGLGEFIDLDPSRPTGSGGASAGGDRFDSATQMIRDRTKALRMEMAVMGESVAVQEAARTRQELMNAAREAEIELSDAQRRTIAELSLGYGEAAQALEEMRDAELAAAEAQQFLGDVSFNALSSMIIHGQEAENVVRNLAAALGEAALQAALLGEGRLAGVYGITGAAAADETGDSNERHQHIPPAGRRACADRRGPVLRGRDAWQGWPEGAAGGASELRLRCARSEIALAAPV